MYVPTFWNEMDYTPELPKSDTTTFRVAYTDSRIIYTNVKASNVVDAVRTAVLEEIEEVK